MKIWRNSYHVSSPLASRHHDCFNVLRCAPRMFCIFFVVGDVYVQNKMSRQILHLDYMQQTLGNRIRVNFYKFFNVFLVSLDKFKF